NIPSLFNSIETRLDEQRDFNRYLVGLLIFLGLLGTFWGLSQTIGAIAGVVSGIDVSSSNLKEAFHTLKQGLQSPLTGMGTAFSSSMFGLASSLVLGFLDLQISKAGVGLFNRVEERLLLRLNYHPTVHSGKAYNLSMMEQNSEGLAALQRLIRSSEENRLAVIQSITALTERLALLTDHLGQQQQVFARLNQSQIEMLEQLKSVTHQLHHSKGDNIRDYLRNLDGLMRKLLEELIEGRHKSLQEIRSEIRLVARTISALAEGHEEAA
ncbi:MAG TPA: flagellar motor protein MotA, partial [Candidatus Nitrosotenuis sp.]|nr:flagellar motor protein MotA [Candidatus Nitrosotenuis sp.]